MTDATTNDAWAKRIFAITLFVPILPIATDFYREAFGFPVMFQDDHSAVFDFGNILVNLLEDSEAHELIAPSGVAATGAGARMQLTVAVDDVDARCAELAHHGVSLINGPINRPWGVRTAAFADPAGHIWEIAQQL